MKFFADIYGNEAQKEYYANAILEKRLHHANIISGNDKSARHLFAVNIIKAMACESDSVRPCGVCPACKSIENGSAPDVIYVKKPEDKSTVLFEQIRDIIPFLMKTPHLFDFIAAVIDIDDMDIRTQNALLKILEEPPSYVYFFLISKDISTVLPTVISRCHTEYTQNFTDEQIKKYILEKYPATDRNKLDFAVSVSQGTIGKALEVLNEETGDEMKIFNFVKECINMLFDAEKPCEFEFITKFSSFSTRRDDYQKCIPYFLRAFTQLMLIKEGFSSQTSFFDGIEASEQAVGSVSADMIMKMKDIIIEFADFLRANLILKNSATLCAARLYSCKR